MTTALEELKALRARMPESTTNYIEDTIDEVIKMMEAGGQQEYSGQSTVMTVREISAMGIYRERMKNIPSPMAGANEETWKIYHEKLSEEAALSFIMAEHFMRGRLWATAKLDT